MRFLSVACVTLSILSSASCRLDKFVPAGLERDPCNSKDHVDHGGEIPVVTPQEFKNPDAKKFYVDGKSLPDVPFDVGPSYAGLLPISNHTDEQRRLFFWFFPTTNHITTDLVFWTNGGPGCSSLEGLSQENGPWTWKPGTHHPVKNHWSWHKLANVLWVEQPFGTGFSKNGDVKTNVTNEEELAKQFVGFLGEFLKIFPELNGSNFYAAGESYAGMYVPYIANYIFEHENEVDLRLKGTWIADPSISYDLVTEQIPAVRFVEKFEHAFALNSTTMAQIRKMSDECGYTNYTSKYLKYPPQGLLPLPQQAIIGGDPKNVIDACNVFDTIYNATIRVNPNFNVYRIFDGWPVPVDQQGAPTQYENRQITVYFNRTDVQKAIHAPLMNWAQCSSSQAAFVDGKDTSDPPTLKVLPNVIDKSERTVILHGGIDFVLIDEGTKIAIQNMTWGGNQGFQKPLPAENFVINNFGSIGRYQTERKLTYVEVNLSGHMLPQWAPWAGLKTLSYLLGRETMESHENDDTLYPTHEDFCGELIPDPPPEPKPPKDHVVYGGETQQIIA